MKKNALLLGIVLILFATTVTAEGICDKQKFGQEYTQTAYSQHYPKLSVPDAKINFSTLNYFVIIKGYELKYDDFFGKKFLYTKVTYCDTRVSQIDCF